MTKNIEEKKEVTILFAGDSGDGIQLTGGQFTNTAALFGNDVSTFPSYPAEIRAPQGTPAGVSGFQLKFGSVDVYTPGDECDVLVVMNAAALKSNLHKLKITGTIIANSEGFDNKNLRLAGYEESPLKNKTLEDYRIYEIDILKLTQESLKDSGLGKKDIDRSKNMFVLGFVYWMYNRSLEPTEEFIKSKFKGQEDLIAANLKVLKEGYFYGDTSETFTSRYNVKPAKLPSGTYRNIMGGQATALGLIAATQKAGLTLFYGSYPITPASDILHELSKHKNFGVKTFQAEDEIAAVGSAIGASFSGALGITASSGPGIALKTEAIGLATMLELPLVVCNIQRGGPSTGLPTKTEQADLLQAVYGRNGECPVPVIAASSPSDCFNTVYEACRIALKYMTPVFFISDGYMTNGAEPWKFPQAKNLPEIEVNFAKERNENDEAFLPYKRNENFVREWAIPGTKGLEHRVGGLEKQHETGNVSYDPDNHEFMVKLRAKKIANIANDLPKQIINNGNPDSPILILGWGSTYGAIRTAVENLALEGISTAHIHLRYINPFPKNLGELLKKYEKVIVPEMNMGQLSKLIRDQFLIDVISLNKIKGIPFTAKEIAQKVKMEKETISSPLERG